MNVLNERYYAAVIGGCNSCDEHRSAVSRRKSESDKECGCSKARADLPEEMRNACMCSSRSSSL